MRTTKKYEKIFGEAENADDSYPSSGNLRPQTASVQNNKDFEVIAAEVRAIIMQAYEADELKNVQP